MLTRSLLVACILALPALASAEPHVVVATDPIGLLASHYTLSVSAALGTHVAVRGDVVVGTKPEPSSGHQLARGAASLQLFLDRAFHGPYLEPGLSLRRSFVDGDYHVEPEMFVGWQWLYHDRYSLAVAAGAVEVSGVPLGLVGPPALPFGTETYVRIGYAF